MVEKLLKPCPKCEGVGQHREVKVPFTTGDGFTDYHERNVIVCTTKHCQYSTAKHVHPWQATEEWNRREAPGCTTRADIHIYTYFDEKEQKWTAVIQYDTEGCTGDESVAGDTADLARDAAYAYLSELLTNHK